MKTLLIIFFLPLVVFCQTGSIKGKIVDRATGQVLIGANVVIKGTSKGAATNLEGKYKLEDLNPGKCTVLCSYIGYNKNETEIIICRDITLTVDFELAKSLDKKEIMISEQSAVPFAK